MTATQRFIEDAIKGGWKEDIQVRYSGGRIERIYKAWGASTWERYMDLSTVLLDPLAWQAVGKMRGWYITTKPCNHSDNYHGTCMRCAWHCFIDHLADGLSIEEALSKADVTAGV